LGIKTSIKALCRLPSAFAVELSIPALKLKARSSKYKKFNNLVKIYLHWGSGKLGQVDPKTVVGTV
jgi:hypothetical protein